MCLEHVQVHWQPKQALSEDELMDLGEKRAGLLCESVISKDSFPAERNDVHTVFTARVLMLPSTPIRMSLVPWCF